jgi:hypothetical protein
MARGLSNAEIGSELYISETTVKTHVTTSFGSSTSATACRSCSRTRRALPSRISGPATRSSGAPANARDIGDGPTAWRHPSSGATGRSAPFLATSQPSPIPKGDAQPLRRVAPCLWFEPSRQALFRHLFNEIVQAIISLRRRVRSFRPQSQRDDRNGGCAHVGDTGASGPAYRQPRPPSDISGQTLTSRHAGCL